MNFQKLLKFKNLDSLINKIFRNSYFLIRLDDSCETQDFKKWNLFEDIFDELRIKPLVAVIPDNKDESLKIDPFNENYWDDVKRWRIKNWTIALNGYHIYFKSQKEGINYAFLLKE